MENGLLPFGPVPRGGSLPDILSLGSGGEATLAARPNNRQRTRSRPLVNSWRNVRSTVRGARRRVVCAVNMSVLREAMSRRADATDHTNSMNGPSMLRVGGMINRRLLRRGRAIDGMETVDCLHVMGDIDAWGDTTSALGSSSSTATAVKKSNPLALPVVRRLFQRKASEQEQQQHDIISAAYETASLRTTGSSLSLSSDALSSRGGGGSSAVAINKSSSSSASVIVVDDRNTMSESYYVIETPLFPIILPKSFEPRTAATNSASSVSSTTSLEISVAMEEEVTTTATAKPSPQLLQAATQPLLPKQVLDSFTGREFYYPESYEALAITGMKMTLCENDHVKWIGEKKTDKFLKEYSANHNAGSTAAAAATAITTNSNEWYTALDSSQEVLVWAGKFTKSKDDDGYGSELPIIKTTSIIHQSPKYLAELLMDSNMVKVYNKMSLGRTDERVFQTGVDTQGGSFGDGESKVVRNLTKPPMVSSLIEFVTCMHARKLRPSDMEILLSPTNVNGSHGDASSEANNEGYIVVSRAVTGDEWSTTNNSNSNGNGEKLVRNEILLGVNILKAVPGEPNKTELTSVTHVYSPMIPLMLAKNAGVKGAVDFVRDIRALP